MKQLMWIFSGLVIGMLFMSCTKDDTISVSNTRQMLLNKKWKITETTSIDSNGNEKDLFSALPPYRKDDYLLFNNDSTYELNDNLELDEDSLSTIIDAGRWALTQNGTYLELHSNLLNSSYEPALIKEISDNMLYVERKYTSDNSIVRTRYIRQ